MVKSFLQFAMVVLFLLSNMGVRDLFAQTSTTKNDVRSISGKVVNSKNGQPIADAIITIVPEKSMPNSMRGARSGPDGTFSLSVAADGQYSLSAERPGFVSAAPLMVAGNDAFTNVVLRLTAQSAIAGRVVDPNGAPLMNAQVQLSQIRFVDGRPGKFIVGQGTTNDLGEYRLFGLLPGSYYVAAFYRDTAGVLGLKQRTMQKEGREIVITEDYVPTYYPGTAAQESAQAVNLKPGQTTSDVNVQVISAPSATLQGTVSVRPEAREVRVWLQPDDANGLGARQIFTLQKGSSEFVFRSVPQGRYVVRTDINAESQRWSARQEVQVIDGSTREIVLQPEPLFSIAGAISMGQNTPPSGLQVQFKGMDKRSRALPRIKPDGTFELTGLAPDKYAIAVGDSSGSVYLKSVWLNGQQVSPLAVDLEQPPRSLQIEVSNKAGKIEGAAVDKDHHRVDHGVVVLVVSSGDISRLFSTHLSGDGTFKFDGLPPGNYRISYLADIGSEQDLTGTTVKMVQQQGFRIAVEEGQKQSVSLVAADGNEN
jgi:hypothetical protein